MRNLTIIVLFLASAGMISCSTGYEKSRDVKQYTIEQFMNNTSIGGG